MDSIPRQLTSASTLTNHRREAKRWLKALLAGDDRARARLMRAHPGAPADPSLRDVQHALALEHGLPGWTALKRQLARGTSARLDLIKPDHFASEKPVDPWLSRGCDIWEAILAARVGDVQALRRLLEHDPKLARYSETLHFAVREGHGKAVRVLLEAGADPDEPGAQGETLITTARDRGHHEVAALLEAARGRTGRTPASDAPNRDYSVSKAAWTNDLDTLRKMLAADPDLVHRGDHQGAAPLHRAIMGGARDAILLLLEHGADVHAVHGLGPGDAAGYASVGYQPIDLALFWRDKGDFDVAALLLERGATVDLTIAAALGREDLVRSMLDADPGRIHETRAWGKRPLSAAVDFGHDAIARLLIDRGADPSWPEGADAPRGLALYSAARRGNRAMVELLLDHGADPNANVNASGNPTYGASTPELRQLLISRGGRLDCYDLVWLGEDDEVVRRVTADPNEAHAGCGGVFAAAATLHKRDLAVRLIAAGARIPPVLSACRSYLMEDPEILRLLLANGMNPDLPNWQRATPIHDLCGRDLRGRAHGERLESAVILLDAGASLVARDEEYRSTPLAWAARNNLPDMVELLLARGAPTNLPDDEPWATPLAWATSRGHAQIVEMLRAAGATT